MGVEYKDGNDVFLGHSPCFGCSSSDGMSCYLDHAFCFSCGTRFNYNKTDRKKPTKFVPGGNYRMSGLKALHVDLSKPIVGSPPVTLSDRRLSKETLEMYGVTVGIDEKGEVVEHYYPYYQEGTLVASKTRFVVKKGFQCAGDMSKSEMFGINVAKQKKGEYITITEGELDAMSVQELTDYPGISVKSAGSAVKDIKANFDFINSYSTIVICFDNDDPGQRAANQVAKLFKAGKVKIMNLAPFKDANDFLKAGKRLEFKKSWWNAPVYQLDGIVAGASLLDEINRKDSYTLVPYPFLGMTDKLYGMRTSEMITITAGTGVGKTTLTKMLAVHLAEHTEPDAKIGLLMLEETKKETVLGLMSAKSHIPFHLPDAKYTQEQKDQSFADTMGGGKFFLHDHFGSTSIDNIIDKIEKLITQYDCKYIVLDHISIVVSDQQSGDERRALDEIATKLKTLTISKDVCLIVVCHLKRIDGKPAEEGGRISLSDIRGTAGIGQLSNVVLGLERDVQGEETPSNQVKIRVLKDRFAGRTGVACELEFDYKTFSFNEIVASDEVPNGDKFKSKE